MGGQMKWVTKEMLDEIKRVQQANKIKKPSQAMKFIVRNSRVGEQTINVSQQMERQLGIQPKKKGRKKNINWSVG